MKGITDMKIKQALISTFLSLAIMFSLSTNIFAIGISDTSTSSSHLNFEDIIAGNNIPSDFSPDMLPSKNFIRLSQQSGISVTSISNGTYYLNNRFEGKFLNKSSSSVNSVAGKLSALQSNIKWVITNYNSTYCLIKPASDSSKCLAGSTSTTSSNVSLISAPSSIPDYCLWEIYVATGGGCIVKNKSSGRVLYSSNGKISTQPNNTTNYDNKVWRIASDTMYTSSRELTGVTFSSFSIDVGESDTPSVSSRKPSNAMWVSGEDFVYSSSSPKIKIDNSTYAITGISIGTASITAVHKITGISKTLTVTVSALKLFETGRRPGLEADGTTARDMKISDLTKSQLTSININLTDLANKYDGSSSSTVLPPEGPDALIKFMKQLPELFAAGNTNMKSVVKSMVDNFISGTGDDFSHSTLTSTVHNHPSTTTFVTNTKKVINSALSSCGGNIYSLISNDSFSNKMDNVSEPAYNTKSDYTNGLKIAINGIWGYDIDITEYKFDGKNYSGTIKYTIFDHFGLDEGDITDSSVTSELLGYTAQFGSWFVLQRYKNCQSKYKPFVTYIVFEETFSGTVS